MSKVIITGGCGFIGHHFVEHFLRETDWDIYVIDKLTYAANAFDRIRDINAFDNKRIRFFTVDLKDNVSDGIVREVRKADYILHLAAETHVDRSIQNPSLFVESNVMGTVSVLNLARIMDNLKAFVLFSTDEVFGPAPEGVQYQEWDSYNCTNPYSATKAAAEQLTLAFINTYKIPGFITHCMNVFGERQHPEKFIPMCIKRILRGEKIFIHANELKQQAGSRFYIHARNVANATHFLLNKYQNRDIYNIVGEREVDNLTLMLMISEIVGTKPVYELVDFHSSRPGHDLRYALDGTKMRDLGWNLPMTFEKSLLSTIEWTLKNRKWL